MPRSIFKSSGVGSYSCGSMPGFTSPITATRSPPTFWAISVVTVDRLATLSGAAAHNMPGAIAPSSAASSQQSFRRIGAINPPFP